MKQTVSFYDFELAFERVGQSDKFSYEGLKALFDWLEEYEDSTGDEVELDVIALCCEFSEYEDLKEFNENYGSDNSKYYSIEQIETETLVIPIENSEGFIIQDF